MSEMIERVARAMMKVLLPIQTPEQAESQLTHDAYWLDAARAAIEAMREPTNHMKAAAHQSCFTCGGAGEHWPAMIDAALDEAAALTPPTRLP